MNKMLYWILSAVMVASAMGETCNFPGRWMFLCTPTITIENTNWNDLISRIIQQQNPTFAKPADCDDSKPIVTTTATPEPTKIIETKNLDTDFETLFEGLLEIFGNSSNKVAPTTTTTTTAAPEINSYKDKINILTETLANITFSKPKPASREFKGEVTPQIAIFIKYLSENPKLMDEISSYLDNSSAYEYQSIEPNQNNYNFESLTPPPVKYTPPSAQYTPAPVLSTPASVPSTLSPVSPTLIKTFSGPFISGHTFEHKSEQSSGSNVQTISHYTYGNEGPIHGYKITSEKVFNEPNTPSVKIPLGSLTQKVPEFVTSKPTVISENNPCDFATGIFRFVPCENLSRNNKFIVEETIPFTKKSYSFNSPYEFQNVHTNDKMKNSIDC